MDSVALRRQARRNARIRETVLYLIEAFVIMAAMGFLIGFMLWHNSYTSIRVSDFVSLNLSGYDHYGTAEVSILGEPEYAQFWSTVTASVNKTDALSNGDELTISYTFDEAAAKECRLKVDAEDAVVTVEGLTEPTVVDNDMVFSGLDITQSGISPKISIEIANTSEDPFVSGITYYEESGKSFFANGDIAGIKAEIPEELLDSHAYVLAQNADEYVYEYETRTDETYVMSADLITDDVLKTLEQFGYDLIYAADANEYGLRIFQQEAHIKPVFNGNKTTFEWSGPYVISAYFHSVTDSGIDMVENHANDVQIVYGVTIRQADGKSCMAEVVVQFTNIVERADHSLDLSADLGRIVSATYRDKNIKKLVSVESNTDYDTVKLTDNGG